MRKTTYRHDNRTNEHQAGSSIASESPLSLVHKGIIIPAQEEPFHPRTKFPRSSYWIGDWFEREVLHVLDKSPVFEGSPSIIVDIFTLDEPGADREAIMQALGILPPQGLLELKELLFIADYLLTQQISGKRQLLNSSGLSTIVGYFQGTDGVRSVSINFSFGQWCLTALSASPWPGGQSVVKKTVL